MTQPAFDWKNFEPQFEGDESQAATVSQKPSRPVRRRFVLPRHAKADPALEPITLDLPEGEEFTDDQAAALGRHLMHSHSDLPVDEDVDLGSGI